MWKSPVARSGKMTSKDDDSKDQLVLKARSSRGDEARVRSKGYVLAVISLLSLFLVSCYFAQIGRSSVADTSPASENDSHLVITPLQMRDPVESLSDPDEATADSDVKGGPYPKGCDARSAKLKLFMYNMPAEFHYGMITEFAPAKGQIWPRNVTDIPRYPGGLYSQHSPEFWLTNDLITSDMADRESPCTAFRVRRRQDADLVFVPFFASLSYNKYSKSDKKTDKDEELQVKLMKFLKAQPAWRASGGIDHVIVIHHPNSMHEMRDQLRNAMFVVADFGRYEAQTANMEKDVVAPYKHVIPTFEDDISGSPYDERTTLLFFQGAIVRKEGGVIRQKLFELLNKEPGVHFLTGNTATAGIKSATQGMRKSKFCLHLAGDTPSSNRLFDAIASHCVPVVISDDIELPYEDRLDYADFCLFIKTSDALRKGFVINLLRGLGSDEWTRMWRRLQQVDHHFLYQHPTQPGDAVNMVWEAIARKAPAVKLALHKKSRYARRVES